MRILTTLAVLLSSQLWGQMALNVEQGIDLENRIPVTTLGITTSYVNASYSTNNELGLGIFINPWEDGCRKNRSSLIIGTGFMATDKDINLYLSAGFYKKWFGAYIKQTGFQTLSIGIMINPFKL